ncbi:MAG: hypothetical protein ACXVCS_00695 [Bdellovibrionota bacterium]
MRILATLLFLFSASSASAGNFCEDENLVIDTQLQWDFSNGFFHDFTLPTHRGGNLYSTKSVLHLGNGGDPNLYGIFEFPRAANEVGLEYNLYRLQIQIGGDDEPDRQIIDQDFTAGCTGPGAGLWPGDRLELKAIKLEPHADGAPRGVESVHLRFWGK